jgi:predicted nucleic acid-binding protein
MRTVFADATFYIAVASPHDQLHAVATDYARSYRGRVVTTEYVLLEVGNMLSDASRRGTFVRLVEEVRADPDSDVVPSSHELWSRGLDLYSHRHDKDWSLTDCISFVVMEDRGLREALTADQHFAQAGYAILLKSA